MLPDGLFFFGGGGTLSLMDNLDLQLPSIWYLFYSLYIWSVGQLVS